MFRRLTKSIPSNAYLISTRGMVTEKQLKMRIASVTSIEKITGAMKMVAAVKLRTSQIRLDIAREFSKDIEEIWEVEPEADANVDLIVGISSDKGLCGAVNSSVIRSIRDDINSSSGDESIMLLGEKARPGLERLFGNKFTLTISDMGNNRPISFKNAGVFADYWASEAWDHSHLYYNYFRSMISYDTTKKSFASLEKASEDLSNFYPYEIEGDSEVMQNLYEFRLGVATYHYLCENDTSTLSSRMNAMDNSSKNAGEMIDTLTMQMNRARQAKITTELIEIISGASAVDESN